VTQPAARGRQQSQQEDGARAVHRSPRPAFIGPAKIAAFARTAGKK
jgi:hypothetical protein